MLVLIPMFLGGLFGGLRAKKRGGNRADIWQYVAVFAILCAIPGLFATLIIHRAAL